MIGRDDDGPPYEFAPDYGPGDVVDDELPAARDGSATISGVWDGTEHPHPGDPAAWFIGADAPPDIRTYAEAHARRMADAYLKWIGLPPRPPTPAIKEGDTITIVAKPGAEPKAFVVDTITDRRTDPTMLPGEMRLTARRRPPG